MGESAKQEAFRVYVTDALKLLTENTAKYAGGSTLAKRYTDIIHPQPEETRTAEEIIDHIKQKLARS